MKCIEDNYKNLMMDHVINELKLMVPTIVVKQNYMAERYETDEMTKEASEYISAYKHQDSFYSYGHYEIYALNKAGLFKREYYADKTNIPEDKRNEVLQYQREFIISNYEEKNNYYRMLIGLPDYGETGIKIDKKIDGVDTSKFVHEMTDNEINILIKNGEMDKLYKKYPEAKYLKYILSTKKISLINAREALPFEILYINRVTGNQSITDMFIVIYRITRQYMLSKFYDTSYEYDSPYYQAFMGLFILTTSIQRYITQYFNRYVSRDFYDKDIIKLFFESYNIPFYNEIPLSYLQKIVKNLNRLLYIKATDKVFVNIFKLFGLDNVDISNYILFKDRVVDSKDRPIVAYNEVQQIGYYVETSVYEISDDGYYGTNKLENSRNTKQITTLGDMEVFLSFSGILKFKSSRFIDIEKMDTDNMHFSKYKGGFYEFLSCSDFQYMYSLKSGINSDDDILVAFTNEKCYVFKYARYGEIVPLETSDLINDQLIENVIVRRDIKNPDNYLIAINTKKGSGYILAKGNFNNPTTTELNFDTITLLHQDNFKIVDMRFYDSAATIVNEDGQLYVFGDNKESRLYFNCNVKRYINEITILENSIWGVSNTLILDNGTVIVMKDGRVCYTGLCDFKGADKKTDPDSFQYIDYLSNVKSIKPLNDGEKNFYIIYFYDSHIDFLNYEYKNRYGSVIFRSDIEKLTSNFSFLRDVSEIDIGYNKLYFIIYDTESYLLYNGNSDNLPYIKNKKLTKQPNDKDMVDIALFNDYLFYINSYGNLHRFNKKEDVEFEYKNVEFRKFFKFKDILLITTNSNIVYRIQYSKVNLEPERIEYTGIDLSHIDFFYSDGEYLSCYNNNEQRFYCIMDYHNYNNKQYATAITDYPIIRFTDKTKDISLVLKKENANNYFNLEVYMNNTSSIYYKKIYGLKSCFKISKFKNYIIFDGYNVMYVDVTDVCDSEKDTITIKKFDFLDDNRIYSDIINNDYIVYDKLGGLIFNSEFPLKKGIDVYSDKEFIEILDDVDTYVQKIDIENDNIIILKKKNKTLTYEKDSSKMYKLKFIEVPLGSTNLAEEFVDSGNYLDYGTVVYDDNLWGGDDDKSKLLKDILDSEFNYVTSKYISISSRYNITKLNFELCYMFSLLTQLKENEEKLTLYIPYVGEIKLFDAIVGLFTITCRKFDFEGTIMDTPTKSLYVLDAEKDQWNINPGTTKVGFNFHQDLDYIKHIIRKATINENKIHYNPPTTLTDINKVKIETPPLEFEKPAELINNYLNNEDVLNQIYDAKWNATTIRDYNAYKRIIDATMYTNYSTDMYRNDDGTLPKTYAEYLKNNCPAMYKFTENTTEENLVDQVDSILVAIGNYLDSDRFKYIFLNIPTLSVDDIKKFITYLIYTFKSYTVELKAMNVIYDIDDKRINNVKLVLSEYFDKHLIEYTDLDFYDFLYMISQNLITTDDIDIDELQKLYKAMTPSDRLVFTKLITFIGNEDIRDTLNMRYSDQFNKINKQKQFNDKIQFKESYEFFRTQK